MLNIKSQVQGAQDKGECGVCAGRSNTPTAGGVAATRSPTFHDATLLGKVAGRSAVTSAAVAGGKDIGLKILR
jgi:hypothetical protein